MPFLTIRAVPGGGRVVWLDAHRASARIGVPILRDLFKRSLVWAQGYALYAEYPQSILLFMDDVGTSDRSYLPYWHYRTLKRRTFAKASSTLNAPRILMDITGYVMQGAVVSPGNRRSH
jgi:hypothetical protein